MKCLSWNARGYKCKSLTGHESTGKLRQIIGENDNKIVKEKDKNQETNIGLNDRSWVDVLSVGIQTQSTNVELDLEFLVKKTKVAKKFVSLWELQDKTLSKNDKKKRDRTSRWKKIIKENLQDSELSGRSLSNSDLREKWERSKMEARRSLELEKKFGLKIKGSEEEVNASGMGLNGKMMIVSRLVKSQRVEVLFLQETKKPEWSVEEIRKLWSDDEFEFKAVEADGRSGSLVTIWDRNCFTLENVCQSSRFLSIMGRWTKLDAQVKDVKCMLPSESFKFTILVVAESRPIRCGGSLVSKKGER
ncbi:hypothetical protein V6N12_038302 [Hibiscus sabdariffa]|uniref:Uncharacterized protein n=1 Tax=Hibiscus sabdariffa TaxID=183260 RepID=A0ABR2BEK4_9ROSI